LGNDFVVWNKYTIKNRLVFSGHGILFSNYYPHADAWEFSINYGLGTYKERTKISGDELYEEYGIRYKEIYDIAAQSYSDSTAYMLGAGFSRPLDNHWDFSARMLYSHFLKDSFIIKDALELSIGLRYNL
jgi:hypothetical protein